MAASVVDPDKEAAGDSSGPAENPCLTRLRHKRLLAFLRGQHYDGAFNALLHQAREQFCLERMQLLVTEGLWEEALEYLNSFLPACLRSFGAQVFHNFLLIHHNIARLVAGHKDALVTILADEWMSHVADAVQSENQLVPSGMIRSVLSFDAVRKCMDWGGVRRYAAQALNRLVSMTPELDGRLTLPARQVMPHDVLPVGLGLSRGRRGKKQGLRVKPAAVARVIRGSRRHIRRLEWSSFESFDEAKECLSAIIDNSLRGGLHTGCYVLKPSGNEVDPTLPIWKVASCAESSGVTAMANAGDPNPQILRVPGCVESSGDTAMANADNSLRGGLHTGCYVLKPSGNEVDPTLPIWKVASCAESYGVTAMANAGDLTRQIWKVTDCVESSGVTAMANAGTEKSQVGCYTEMENAHLAPRKNPRAEHAIIDFLGMKKQRIAGAFGEASMGPPSFVGVEGRPLAAPRFMITS